jgi:uncharacterized membrane protein
MRKRIIIYVALALGILLVAYIYGGMFWAQKSDRTMETDTAEDISQLERLQNAGAMSEESRQDMINRLDKAR